MNSRCERKGHKVREVTDAGYASCSRWEPDGQCIRSHVADRVTRKRTVCVRRCDMATNWVETSRKGIDSLTMSDSLWDKLNADGWVSTS